MNNTIITIFTIFTLLLIILIVYFILNRIKKNKNNDFILLDRSLLLKKINNSKSLKYKTLILINIDSFEDINDYYGYDFGDEILKQVYYWLSKNLPNNDAKLYKLEADNYAIFTKKYKTKKELKKYLHYISSKIIGTTFKVKDNKLDIGFTIGAAINQNNLLKLAHTAFKKSKDKKTQYEIYSNNSLLENMQEKNIKMTKIIKQALQNHKVIPYFQPIYDIKLNKIDKYESLMRLQSKENKIINPADFLETAKKTKLYPKLTKEIFNQVLESAKFSNCDFSINLSVNDILNKKTSQFILKQLEKRDIGSWLVFEILESEGIENYKQVTNFLRELKALGGKIAIDDFGSGYSNFEYILKLDVDFLKIDGSLIKNIDINEDEQIIASTIVDFAKKLKIKTIAEYVHNKNVYDMVKKLGFNYAQGYYISEPQPQLITSKNLDYLL